MRGSQMPKKNPLKENLVVIREFIKEFESTGTLFPTSVHAAKALSAPILERSGPKRILEVGPGTGSVTVQILEYMSDTDELAICEINPRFMKVLKDRLATLPSFRRHRNRVHFYECGAQDLPEIGLFDVVVCALPFLNFPLALTQQIFARLERLSAPHTVMTYYEYIGLREINRVIAPQERKTRIQALEGFYNSMKERWHTSRQRVWRNMTPIFVYRISICPSNVFTAAA